MVADFMEMGAPTYGLYEAEQVVLILHLSETLQVFWSHYYVFALEK